MEIGSLLILNIMNAGIALIMGFYMFFLQRNSLSKGPGYWTLGAIIIGVGLLLKAILPVEHIFSIAVFPIFLTIGLYLYLAGIYKFKEKNINKWIFIGIPVLDILQTIIFLYIFPSRQMQIGLHVIVIFIYALLGAIEMLRLNSAPKHLKKIFLLNASTYVILLVLLMFYIHALITNPNIDPLKISNIVIISHIVLGFLMIATTFGFLSVVNIQLNSELEDQLKSKIKFLSIIGHDLRSPVGTIINFLDLLQTESDLNEHEKKEFLGILNKLSWSTYNLLQNLLEWATKSKYLNKFESERIDLSEIISNNIPLFKSSTTLKSINLEINQGKQTYIQGNLNMINSILRNIVSNAVKYTPLGGTIIITTERVLKIIRLTVSDTGQGIQPEIINSLFEYGVNQSTIGTNGEVGSGLGLVLCKELVTNNEGVIKIESHEGVGTKVVVEFPAVA
jgi:signal transduction histidine kinase